MTEIFDININDLIGEDSEFISSLKASLESLDIEVNADDLSIILQEYEMVKMDFLKNHIINSLAARGTNLNELQDGPLKVVFSNNRADFETIDEADEDQTDSNIVS